MVGVMSPVRSYRAGESLEDYCRACKTDRQHTVVAADPQGQPIRVVCGFCGSEHNYRGGPRINTQSAVAQGFSPVSTPSAPAPRRAAQAQAGGEPFPIVSDRERVAPAMASDASVDLELLIRRVIREECGITAVTPAEKWRGGTLVLRPGTPGLQEKSLPDRNVLPQDRDAAQPAAIARAAGERRRAAGRCEGQAAGLRHGMLRIADELQRAVRRRGGSIQRRGRV